MTTTKVTLDRAKAIDLLDTIVAAKPVDYRYHRGLYMGNEEECVYFEGNQPSCIVGHVLASFGITQDELEDLGLNESPCSDLWNSPLHNVFTPEESGTDVMWVAQVLQDKGKPWRKVLAFIRTMDAEATRRAVNQQEHQLVQQFDTWAL